MDATLLRHKPSLHPTWYFNCNFLIMSLIVIKNKCFSDVIWNLKREEKKLAKKVDSYLGWSRQNYCHTLYHLHHESWQFIVVFCNVD